MSVLPPPSSLSAPARAEWERMAPRLAHLGLLTELDLAAFEMYCRAYARWQEAEARVQQAGPVIKSGQKMIANPFLDVAIKAEEQCLRLLTAFGMTPASRESLAPAYGLDLTTTNGSPEPLPPDLQRTMDKLAGLTRGGHSVAAKGSELR